MTEWRRVLRKMREEKTWNHVGRNWIVYCRRNTGRVLPVFWILRRLMKTALSLTGFIPTWEWMSWKQISDSSLTQQPSEPQRTHTQLTQCLHIHLDNDCSHFAEVAGVGAGGRIIIWLWQPVWKFFVVGPTGRSFLTPGIRWRGRLWPCRKQLLREPQSDFQSPIVC